MLPKPDGPLSRLVPASSIAAANKEVKRVLDLPTALGAEATSSTSKRGTYDHFTQSSLARSCRSHARLGSPTRMTASSR